MDQTQYQNLRYLILPGSPGVGFAHQREQKLVYDYWKSYWQKLLDEINPGEKINPEYFFDQDMVNVILDGDKVVAMQGMKYYDLRCGLRDHSVFQPFTADFWQHLEQRKIDRIFTYRWFRVAEDYGYKATGISFAIVITELSHRIYDLYQEEGLGWVAHSRTDIGASKVASKFGWHEVGEPQILHGVPCAQLVLEGKRAHCFDADANRLARTLWAKRENLSSWHTGETAMPSRKAA